MLLGIKQYLNTKDVKYISIIIESCTDKTGVKTYMCINYIIHDKYTIIRQYYILTPSIKGPCKVNYNLSYCIINF